MATFLEMYGRTLEEAFLDFHMNNPQVYESFKQFTFELINLGKRKSSTQLIINRIRWDVEINTNSNIDHFKINHNFAAYYARLFMKDFPEYAGFFETRSLTAETKPQILRDLIYS